MLTRQQQTKRFLVYMEYDSQYLLLMATEALYNDIVDKCSDDVLFKFYAVETTQDNPMARIFKVNGKTFKHKSEVQYMLPNSPVETIKDIFGIC